MKVFPDLGDIRTSVRSQLEAVRMKLVEAGTPARANEMQDNSTTRNAAPSL